MEREEVLEQLIRWLRPDYQVPRFAPNQEPGDLGITEPTKVKRAAAVELPPWPLTVVEQLPALTAFVSRGPVTVEEAVPGFAGANRKLVARHLKTQAMLGAAVERGGQYGRVRAVA